MSTTIEMDYRSHIFNNDMSFRNKCDIDLPFFTFVYLFQGDTLHSISIFFFQFSLILNCY